MSCILTYECKLGTVVLLTFHLIKRPIFNFQSTLCWNCNVTMAFPCTIIIKLLYRFSYLKIDSKIISCDRLNKFLQSTPINFCEKVSWKLDAKLHRVTAPVDFVWSHAKSKLQPSCRQMDRPTQAVSKLPFLKGALTI